MSDEMRARIRKAREAKGLTQAELATRMSALGVALHPSAVAKIELGPRVVTVDELVAIARVLDVSVELLAVGPSDDPTSDYQTGYQDGLRAALQVLMDRVSGVTR